MAYRELTRDIVYSVRSYHRRMVEIEGKLLAPSDRNAAGAAVEEETFDRIRLLLCEALDTNLANKTNKEE